MPNGGGGGGGGYSIPISGSQAQALGQNIALGTTFNFNSAGASGGWFDQTATPVARAEATAASAPGGTATAATGGGESSATLGGMDTKTLLIVAAIAGAVILGAVALVRFGKP